MSFTIENRRNAWNAYWATGVVQSYIGKSVENNEGAINQFWHAQFEKLVENAKVLDLATGNGVVPKLLLSRKPSVRIDAVDLADTAPQWCSMVSYPNLCFHSNVNIEALPFDDAQFDLVTSQFGLEYASWPEAVREAVRVCSQGGRLAFVLHCSDSLVVALGKIELAHQQHLLMPGGVLEMAQILLPKILSIQAGAKPDEAALQAREAYNHALLSVANVIAQSEAPDLLIEARENIHSILSGRFGTGAAQRYELLGNYKQALDAAVIRTSELLLCALDSQKIDYLLELIRACRPGSVIECQLLRQQEGILAWGVSVF